VNVAALCAGYGGLELGLTMAGIGVDLTWYAETDKHASQVMAHHHPDAPNLGDLTAITDPPPVDIVTAGFPCQPVSMAGKRKGITDERWLIDDVCRVARNTGADWLILENVAGLLSANGGDAMARVVSAMAENGFSARWACVRASDVGAPHQRLRWFCVGNPADTERQRTQIQTLRQQPTIELSGSDGEDRSAQWGPYAAAINRWEPIVGRLAPNPTDDRRRLNPRFVEWMMGLPPGHVTDAVDGRTHQLRILGNGVVPQQAAHALATLTNHDWSTP
jgi:DNA (cytosine-5)-methyltransferase 1